MGWVSSSAPIVSTSVSCMADDKVNNSLWPGFTRCGSPRLHQVSHLWWYSSPILMYLTIAFARRWRALQNPPSPESEKASPHVPAGPKKDYSLKDGQTFSISIPGRAKANQNTASDLFGSSGGSTAGSSGLGVPLLPPPPPGAPRRR